MRTRGSELGGIGHPLVDALLKEIRECGFAGEILRIGGRGIIVVRYLVRYDDAHGQTAARVVTLRGKPEGEIKVAERMEWTRDAQDSGSGSIHDADIEALRARFEDFKKNVILEWIPDRQRRTRVTTSMIGIHVE